MLLAAPWRSPLALCTLFDIIRPAATVGSGSARLLRYELRSEDSSKAGCNNIEDIVADSEARLANTSALPVQRAKPSKALTDDWRCDEGIGFCNDFRASSLVTQGELGSSVAPHGHVGDRLLLSERLQEAWHSRRLSLAVFGNSITCGAHCSEGPWALRLVQLLEKANLFGMPKQVEMQIHAMGGATSAWAATRIGELATKLSKVHVVFVDLSMGDVDEVYPVAFYTKMFVSLIRALQKPPAIVYIELFPFHIFKQFDNRKPWCPKAIENRTVEPKSTWDQDPCTLDVRCFPHWQTLVQMNVPVISYFDAVCAALPRKDNFVVDGHLRYWHPGRTQKNNQGPQHPSCDTHEVLAHLTAEFLSQGIFEASDSTPTPALPVPKNNASSKSAPWNVGDLNEECLLSPVSILESASPTETALTEVEASIRKDDSATHTSLTGPKSFPAFAHRGDWRYMEDVKGKPGWISQPGSGGEINFPISTEIGNVIIEYLSTYSDDIGTATCSVGNGTATKLEAKINQTISVSVFQTLRASPAKGAHNLTCYSDGRKFKILSIHSC